jgi:hypothetical protein
MFRTMQTASALLLWLTLLVCDAALASGGVDVSLSCPSRPDKMRRSVTVPRQRKHQRCMAICGLHRCLHVTGGSSGGGSVDSRQPCTSKSAPPSLNLLQRYSRLIDTKPLTTKAITAGSIAALADVVTQAYVLVPRGGVSWRRVAAFLLAGALFVGPYLHLWYSKLDAVVRPLPRHSVRTVAKMLLDQSIGVSIFFPMYFTAYELASSLMHARCTLRKQRSSNVWNKTGASTFVFARLMLYRCCSSFFVTY